jgi:hypothetical protein
MSILSPRATFKTCIISYRFFHCHYCHNDVNYGTYCYANGWSKLVPDCIYLDLRREYAWNFRNQKARRPKNLQSPSPVEVQCRTFSS